jgi:hypothetical protein
MSVELMKKLNPDDATFVELKKKGKYPWWENLKKDEEDISIQIRKDNYIDVYRNGGAILKGLKYNTREETFTAKIHSKYIPLKNDYVGLTLNAKGIEFTEKIEPMDFLQFNEPELKAVKQRVKDRFKSETEKAIQYKFATSDSYIIDTEFEMEREDLRIDLIRLDTTVKKIVLIEVKRMGDSRLFAPSSPGKENVYDQLKKYRDFAVKHKKDILAYYSKVLKIKNNLEIAKPELKELTLSSEWEVVEKPLLLFGDCNQNWIDGNEGKIKKKIEDVAYGTYYFGNTKPSLNLIHKTKGNRHIY